jgi:histidyl-tRNA synthetase
MIKLPRGTRDYDTRDYQKLRYLNSLIEDIFIKYDGKPIETPVFELTDVLMDKYGEEEKLIYNLERHDELNQRCERLSLRYDHTVPFVRYCLTNKIDKMKRYCIGKVYRRETTALTQIRQREFYQADFDFVGHYDDQLPELQIFCMIQELFQALNVTNYQIMYNYRQNLDFYVKEAGICSSKSHTVCSSIDKLDKVDKQTVREELLLKGISDQQIDKLYDLLFSEQIITDPCVREMNHTFTQYMEQIQILDMSKITYTPTLARGLDYYTGIIFEVKLIDSAAMTLCAGGRYDGLINRYRKDETSDPVPMIGFCFGIDRILPLVNHTEEIETIKIWVSVIGRVNESTRIKLGLVGRLIDKGFVVLYNLSDRAFKKEIAEASEKKCNYIVMIGQTEFDNDSLSIKNMMTHGQITIQNDDFDQYFDQL